MHGKRISFFMNSDDEGSFANYIFSTPNVCLVRADLYPTPKYDEFCDIESFLHQPILSTLRKTSNWLIWPKDLGPGKLYARIYTTHGRFSGLYEINDARNPTIFFKRSYKDGDQLTEGELVCFQNAIDPEGKTHIHDPGLVQVFNRMARYIKKLGVKATWDGEKPVWNFYILHGAAEFYNSGGKLGRLGIRPPGRLAEESGPGRQ